MFSVQEVCTTCDFDTTQAAGWGGQFVPRWHCGDWPAWLGWTHIVSDVVTWMAYTAIPLLLFLLVRRRGQELPRSRLIVLFSLFILSCGTGHLIEAIIFWNPIYGVAGATKAITAVVSAVTVVSLVRAFPSLLELRSPTQLEQIVQERTCELRESQRDLECARQRAEEADRAKTRFLATMSHELRTPLAAILGNIELLSHDTKVGEAEQRERLDTVRRNAEHQLALIQDVLEMAKVEKGGVELHLQPVSVDAVVREAIELVTVKAAEKGLDLEVAGEPRGVAVMSDPVRIKQILVNLLANAIKFTDQGRVRVAVETSGPREGSFQVDFLVSDTGAGIRQELVERIFEPYRQADASTFGQHGGTGLGLSISKGLARVLGGDLTVTSREGEGSTFRLRIEAPAAIDALRPALPAIHEATLDGIRVLLAEDLRDLARVTKRQLELAGCEVVHAEDGEQALEAFSRGSFDIVLLDLQMPRLSGWDVAERIRCGGWQGPIVALTANALFQTREQCRQQGFTAHCTKPIAREKLIEVLAGLTAASGAEPAEGRAPS